MEKKNQKKNEDLPACCRPKKKGKGVAQGILFGLIPHAGCIAFILFSIFGVSVAASIFKPLLMNSYFFYSLIILSFVFATIAAIFYLKRNSVLSLQGVSKNKGYLSILYGTTIVVNLILFLVVFPMLANASSDNVVANNQGAAASTQDLKLKVQIPCSGHASLIIDEVKKVDGVLSVKYSLPNIFTVSYDTSKTDQNKILNAEIFKEFKATPVL